MNELGGILPQSASVPRSAARRGKGVGGGVSGGVVRQPTGYSRPAPAGPSDPPAVRYPERHSVASRLPGAIGDSTRSRGF